ncbi:PLP-dependent aminotransferase family protein [Microbacterium sp. Sa4CUA7]|uniref:PLP-dependent aminotransferase family protein n=1 Tax=Microbacterium pullorum TaxID=2762236 RepID=A0ABR8S217_9MICO|nr:PLP-dependent aminotransferase family protein [Microbacterium pullorum]MBD7957394.1 PLP-dependent aminotransferase family protein [Microbacterium pullorum]
MAVHWPRTGPDLLVTLDRDAGALGIQLQDQVRAAIRSGRLLPGERLPSTRQLATVLEVSRGTVVDAYDQLLAEGYLHATAGSGTRVATLPPGLLRASAPAAPVAAPATVADFVYGIPDLRSVPLADWRWALGEATRTLPTAELGDGDPAGSMRLREVITAYHRRVRAGCAVAADAIVVAGFREGLFFVLSALARHGIVQIGLEDPGPYEHDVIARRAGMKPVPVAVDDQGVDVARLRRSGARAVLLTPAHQCPTGGVLGPARRRELVAWAEEVDGVILEDDYDAEFRYDRQPVGSLQGLAPSRVIALGSVSKTLAPAIRLGWVFAPARYSAGIIEEKRLRSRGAPALDQQALALLLETGRYDRHLRRMREVYRTRRDVLVAAVDRTWGPGRVQGTAAGCHVLLLLPEGASEAAVAARAATRGVKVNPLGRYRFRTDPDEPAGTAPSPLSGRPALVLGFGNVDVEQIRQGIDIIAAAVSDAAECHPLEHPPRTAGRPLRNRSSSRADAGLP